MQPHLCIDVCSGRGGFSQSFLNDENWEVVTIDILRKFEPTIVADVCYLPLRENLQPDVLLMSPPCERFSFACLQFPKIGIKNAMMIVGACLEVVAYLKPKRWLMENPKGRLRWFIGIPPKTIRYSDYDLEYKLEKLTDLWGNIPLPMVKGIRKIKREKVRDMLKRLHSWEKIYPHDKGLRAFIPKGVSEAVRQGVEEAENASQEI